VTTQSAIRRRLQSRQRACLRALCPPTATTRRVLKDSVFRTLLLFWRVCPRPSLVERDPRRASLPRTRLPKNCVFQQLARGAEHVETRAWEGDSSERCSTFMEVGR
jgi:hypothetical protein